ncbi:MAG: uracil-DNA glycosylase [bacterium]|nr:uracil-DNA glycosylase [bacterium]
MDFASIDELTAALTECRRCPRLVEWREQVARDKRASFADDDYWGRPVPGFGDPAANVVIVGLAPAAHGANRTGRMFTGDRSGQWLFRALHEAGFANKPASVGPTDGLALDAAWITAPVRCAPPANKPTTDERDSCSPWFETELDLLVNRSIYICLGQYGYHSLWRYLGSRGVELPRPRPKFGHGVEISLPNNVTVLLSFHPSQQNTFTGRLTREMFAAVFERARQLSGPCPPTPAP